MRLSVVIPCRDDMRIFECIRSVDADAEILVVLNGSPPGFGDTLRQEFGTRVRVETLALPNLSLALEQGTRAASWDHVLFMDSDCVFEPGSIAAIERAFERGTPSAEVYKGRIVFDPGRGPLGHTIARSRNQRMSGSPNAYKPPLALSREISEQLGGYFFDERLIWKEDADLHARVCRAGLRVVPIEGCVIHHAPLSLRADLTSSFRYGVGAAIARHLAIPLERPRRSVLEALRRDGVTAALYMGVSNLVRGAGQVCTSVRLTGPFRRRS